MATVNEQLTTQVDLAFPQWGGWRAEVQLDSGDVPLGQVTLTIGTLVLKGTVQRGWLDYAGKPHLIVRGGLGWKSPIAKPLSFQSDCGVRLSTVLNAIASAAGQPIVQPANTTIGEYYECIASRPGALRTWEDALNDLVRSGLLASWRVDPDGVTRFGARNAEAVSDRATVLMQDGGKNRVVYGIDDPIQFLPGNQTEEGTLLRVFIHEAHNEMRADCYIATDNYVPPLSTPEMVRQYTALAFEEANRRYIVARCRNDGRLDLVPPPDAKHLPEMQNVESWVGGGTAYFATPGDEVAVSFLDAKHTQPIVCGVKHRASVTESLVDRGCATLFTTEDATPTGRPIFFRVQSKDDPKDANDLSAGFYWESASRMSLNGRGFHVRDHGGARIDMGAMGMPAPLDMLGTYATLTAAKIDLQASLVGLGSPALPQDPIALSSPINVYVLALTAFVGQLVAAVNAGLTGIGAGPAANGAVGAAAFSSALGSAVATLTAAQTALALAMPSKSTSSS